MCGILVWIKKNGYIDQNLFKESLKTIIHRGPESQKIFLINKKSKESSLSSLERFTLDEKKYDLAFGSTRFGTFDSNSKNSDMPMISQDGNYVISFNGDVYNFQNLKNDLIKKNVQFSSNGDTEVLLNGLIQEKELFLKKINSDFAFVFLDLKKNEIIFSRDTYGTIPLFYYCDEEQIVFSSEIYPIIKILKNKNIQFNKKLYDYFIKTNEWLYDDNSNLLAYNNINSVKPGSINYVNLNNFKFSSNNLLSIETLLSNSSPVNKDELENILLTSLKIRLNTDKNVAIFLSGGLDSSLLVSLYLKHYKKDFNNVEIFTSENYGNDLNYVKGLSNELNFKFKELKIGYNENIFDYIDDITLKTFLPTSTYGNSIGQFAMFKEIKKQNKGVVITGHGGDQIFSGLFSHPNASLEYMNKLNFFQSFFHAFFSDSLDQQIHKLLLKHYLNKIKFRKIFQKNHNYYAIPEKYSEDTIFLRSVKDQQITDIKKGNFCTSSDVINFLSMSNSVSVRSPLIDKNLLRFINNKLSDKFKYGYDRYLLRKILKKYENNIHKRKQKQGLRWRGQYLFNRYEERIIEVIKQSSFYNKHDEIYNLISNKNNVTEEKKDVFLKYYSLARFEKLIISNLR